jgi:nicotinate phosphoribosyltransferase
MNEKSIYKLSLALLTDLYELTMAYGYWKEKIHDHEAVFHLFFRKRPFQGSFAVAAGLQTAIEFIQNFRFDQSDLDYLKTLKGGNGHQIFEDGFLDYLKNFSISCDVDAMPEGTPVFPYEPLLRVQGPIIQAQLLESALLNIINFQTLIATKAARICWAAKPDEVVEFGLRRAQGIDGAISASRAAFIGGCKSTSNVLAGKLFGIPVKGTHAHSWIMAFEEEVEAFRAFAKALPDHCIFLIDTYESLQGVRNAVQVGKEMRKEGKEMFGVRLDSGDLAHLSIEVRKILDQEGFPDAKIMASNELNEELIRDLKQQGTKVTIWGVGTHLVTGKEQPALDGVYKLSAVRSSKGKWQYRIKISEQLAKVTDPGILQVRRYFDDKGYSADMLYDVSMIPKDSVFIDPVDPSHVKRMHAGAQYKDLLVPILRKGKNVYEHPPLSEIQNYSQQELNRFHPAIRRFTNPQPYFVGLEKELYGLKMKMIEEIQQKASP